MNRIERNKMKLMMVMRSKMDRLFSKIIKEYNESYFELDAEEKMIIQYQIAYATVNAALEIINYQFVEDEIPSILELAQVNLEILEYEFIKHELYAFAAIMCDSRSKVTNEVFEMVRK